ncbi:MAG: transglycosylase domain-containing protein [Akkermansiaceae bacterium]
MGKKRSRSSDQRGSTPNKRRKRKFFKLKWLVYLFLFGLICAGVGYLVFEIKTKPYKQQAASYDLSKIDDVEVKSLILDRKGREIGRMFVENRDKIEIKDVPLTMINALVAGEDQRFFEHDGVDRVGVVRAVWLNWKAGRQTQGASTITQQLARNAFHLKEEADERDQSGLERKAVEAFLALRIEEVYSKREILQFYLNRIPFGSGYYGIRSASLGYFGKEPRDLTISECASLVGCIKNPTTISPLNNIEANKKARDQVLRRMAAEEFITIEESQRLQEEPVVVNPKPIRRGTSHLYERIAGAVRTRLGEDALTEGGFKIFTTIDKDVQQAMETSLLDQLATVESREGYSHPRYQDYREGQPEPKYLQGSGLMIENTSGAVVAYVGGRDFTHNQYDFVQSGSKPIGTAFFPFIYTAALEQGMSLVSQLIDRPMDNRAVMVDGREGILGEWGMEVLKPSYEGDISMRRALDTSKIAASVRLGKSLGLGAVMETARKFGLKFPQTKLLARMLVGTDSASLPDMVRAYAVFPNQGVRPDPIFFIDRIVDASGSVRYQHSNRTEPKRVTSEQTAFLMHSTLQSALREGVGAEASEAGFGSSSLAGKTGTTYDFGDNWFVGYNSQVSCGMWMGFRDGSNDAIYPGAFSRETVLPAWLVTMKSSSRAFPDRPLTAPEKIVQLDVCTKSGLRKTRYCQKYNRDPLSGKETYTSTAVAEFFVQGTEPTGYCDEHGGMGGQSVVENHDYGTTTQKTTAVLAIPIQPKQPLLLGDDPYGTEQPDFAPRDANQTARRESSTSFDQLEQEDEASSIRLDRPARVEIHQE